METEPTKAEPAKRKRSWFQFSLRTLLIFTLICAVACAWLARKIDQKRKEREAMVELGKLGGHILYDANPSGPDWLQKFLGENYFSEANQLLFDWGETKITDAGLANLKRLTKLQFLRFAATNVTDAGLEHLTGLTELQSLYLDETNITDAGLGHVKALTQLQWLSLGGTKVTDAGLVNLKALTRLQTLVLSRTRITDAGVKDLQEALPNCKIVR